MNEENGLKEISKQIFDLVQVTSKLSAQMNELQKSLAKIEAVTPSIIIHEEKIEQLKISLESGSRKFEKIDKQFEKTDSRLDALEKEDGNKAKRAFATVGSYLLVTIAAAVVSNIGNIIDALGGK